MIKDCREKAGYTQEVAHEHLHIGLRSLQEYEKRAQAPLDVVREMVILYGTPHLVFHTCKECPLGDYHPRVQTKNLELAYIGFVKEVGDVQLLLDDLLNIMSDGIVDEKEAPRYRQIMKEKVELMKSLQEEFLAAEEKGLINLSELIAEVDKEKAPSYATARGR